MRKRRIFILMCIVLSIYLGLLCKIAYYQVIKGYSIARQAVAMRSKQIELKEFSRGEILDRNLLPLTGTITSTALYCFPQEMGKSLNSDKDAAKNPSVQSFKEVAEFLNQVIDNKDNDENHQYNKEREETRFSAQVQDNNTSTGDMDKKSDFEALESEINKNNMKNKTSDNILSRLNNATRLGRPFVRIASDLTDQEIQKINSSNLSGIVIAPVIKRYKQDGFCAHLLGYVTGNSTNSEGRAGIEKVYDDLLKESSSSQELTSVLDARGMAIKGLMFKVRQEQDRQKASVVLTIDKRIQEIVENTMSKRVNKGAVVVMDVHSKEVLAMASRPTFNPYHIENVLDDNESSLRNRALCRYHPGSLFKILVASAALEEGVVKTGDRFFCSGKYVFNDKVSISCWKEEGHGELNFARAFALSCNPSFIEVGLKLGKKKLLDYVDILHITDETIIGYKNNAGTYVEINPGEPALGNACLGQQGIMLTPLQLTSLISTVADGGYWGPPSLVKYIVNKEGQKDILLRPGKKQVISRETAETVQELMKLVVSEGTGKTASIPEVKVAGKTATSQTGIIKGDEEILNTWFGGFFPADNPRWAIVILVEGGESGAKNAAPVFKDIARGMLNYFSITK